MCGRFALTASEEALTSEFKLVQGFKMVPRYNIAPSQVVPVVRNVPSQLDFIQWGFVPSWAKADQGKPKAHINARSESIQSKPTFKKAFQQRRCLIPASGYFEWKTIKEKKQPFYITAKEHPLLAFAGIWETWTNAEHVKVETFAILTVEAQDQVARIHDRMPLICLQQDYNDWLNPKTKISEIERLLTPPTLDFSVSPVSPRVSNPKFDDPSCLAPLSQ